MSETRKTRLYFFARQAFLCLYITASHQISTITCFLSTTTETGYQQREPVLPGREYYQYHSIDLSRTHTIKSATTASRSTLSLFSSGNESTSWTHLTQKSWTQSPLGFGIVHRQTTTSNANALFKDATKRYHPVQGCAEMFSDISSLRNQDKDLLQSRYLFSSDNKIIATSSKGRIAFALWFKKCKRKVIVAANGKNIQQRGFAGRHRPNY
ncbi:Uncharacterized protein HZ326_18148 [Fusarium oxysporum f. sp. albedinis]|nr:Uncharacterized protein HZ326_18148 [Fusarium oxysporum f. sp. albedinis]